MSDLMREVWTVHAEDIYNHALDLKQEVVRLRQQLAAAQEAHARERVEHGHTRRAAMEWEARAKELQRLMEAR